MADTVIYHNPRCSTSRKTLDLLRDSGLEPEVVEYLKNPPVACRAGEDDSRRWHRRAYGGAQA